jgi:hypothetical protein
MTLNEVFLKIPPKEARGLFKKVEEAAIAHGLFYEEDDGTQRAVPILIRPRIIRPEQEKYFHGVCEELTASVEELTRLYQEDKRIRELLPFTEAEEKWLRDIRKKVGKQPQTVVARIDANVDFAATDWKTSFNFFETNSVGVGGMYMAPACAQILRTVVMPVMQRYAPSLVVKDEFDTRQLLLEQITIHAKVTKKRRINTAFVQEKDLVGGASEFPHFVEYFKSKGIPAVHADPRELRVKGEEILVGDMPVDVLYRDSEISGYIELEADGHDVSGMKTAFMRNQVVSSIAGDFDHKSVFEILTTPEFAKMFTKKQQQIFEKHVLWTRIVSERKSTGLEDEPIDLVPWLRRNKDRLILKPNRSFGGEGIVIGPHVDLAAWDQAIGNALEEDLEETGGTVAQRYVEVRTKDFPVLTEDGIALEEFYVVAGFLSTPRGLGILGRASKKRVVNVGQRGGLTAVLVMV